MHQELHVRVQEIRPFHWRLSAESNVEILTVLQKNIQKDRLLRGPRASCRGSWPRRSRSARAPQEAKASGSGRTTWIDKTDVNDCIFGRTQCRTLYQIIFPSEYCPAALDRLFSLPRPQSAVPRSPWPEKRRCARPAVHHGTARSHDAPSDARAAKGVCRMQAAWRVGPLLVLDWRACLPQLPRHLAALQLVVREHDVVRLDVPVADALLVDEEHRLYELLHLGTKGGLRPTHTRRFDAESENKSPF